MGLPVSVKDLYGVPGLPVFAGSDEALPEDTHAEAFAQGVAQASTAGPGDLTRQLFGTRTLGLTKRLPGGVLADYLSGLLIGSEIVSGLAAQGDRPVLLVGSGALRLAIAGRRRHWPAGLVESQFRKNLIEESTDWETSARHVPI